MCIYKMPLKIIKAPLEICRACPIVRHDFFIVWGERNRCIRGRKAQLHECVGKEATSPPHQPKEIIKICIYCNTVCDNCQARQESIERH